MPYLFFRYCVVCFCFFLFKQKTAYEMRISDWSSDVCSSDLSAERWELVEHEQQPVRSCARVQLLGQAAPDLVEDEPDERLGPADVGWRNDQIERHRMGAFDQLPRSEEHTSELQSLMRISYAVFCLKKKKKQIH